MLKFKQNKNHGLSIHAIGGSSHQLQSKRSIFTIMPVGPSISFGNKSKVLRSVDLLNWSSFTSIICPYLLANQSHENMKSKSKVESSFHWFNNVLW